MRFRLVRSDRLPLDLGPGAAISEDSAGGESAVDRKCYAVDVGGAGAAQPQHGVGDLGCAAQSGDGCALCHGVFVEFSGGDHAVDHRRLDDAGTDGVDPDALAPLLEGC